MTKTPEVHVFDPAHGAEPEAPSVHPRVRRVFDALDGAGLVWALLRTPDGGLLAPRGDVDLLLREGDLPRSADVLRAAGFVRVPRGETALHFLDYCSDSDRWLWLHLVTSVSVGKSVVRLGEGDVEPVRPRTGMGIPTLDDGVAFWLLVWHCVNKGTVAEHHRPTLTRLSGTWSARPALADAVRTACHDLPMDDLVSAIASSAWEAAAVLIGELHERTRRRRGGVGAPLRRLGRALRSRSAHRRAPGISVAVLGPDGAGKTSLVRGLRAAVPLPARIVYMGLTGGALQYAARLRLPGLVFAASAIVVWGRYATGRYHTALGRLVLFDRYVYDAVAPHARRTRPWHRASRWMLARLCPGPDLVLLLNAPGAVMFARKGAYSAAVLEDWRRRFLTLRDRLPNVHVIDATQPADAVRVEATRVIWRCLARRWSRCQMTGGGR
jgi:thymidylate kinase